MDWKAVVLRLDAELNPPYFGRWFFHGVLGWLDRTLQQRAYRRTKPRP